VGPAAFSGDVDLFAGAQPMNPDITVDDKEATSAVGRNLQPTLIGQMLVIIGTFYQLYLRKSCQETPELVLHR
jgi:hypothetical protein